MNRAARVLGADAVTVFSQVGVLERSVGGALVNRSSRRHEPQSLTVLGRKLLAQADERFGAPDVGEPAPEPLGSVLAGLRGEERLQKFVVVAEAATWADAAEVLGATPGAVRQSMTRLEKVAGGRLFADRAARGPVQLSRLGRKLCEQACRHVEVGDASAARD
jgi:DNA-binding transcriptional LysR family regulator